MKIAIKVRNCRWIMACERGHYTGNTIEYENVVFWRCCSHSNLVVLSAFCNSCCWLLL